MERKIRGEELAVGKHIIKLHRVALTVARILRYLLSRHAVYRIRVSLWQTELKQSRGLIVHKVYIELILCGG